MHNTNSQVSVSIGDLIEAAGFQTPLYRPVMFEFPVSIPGRVGDNEVLMSGECAKQWEFDTWQFTADSESRKIINNVPIFLSKIEVNPLNSGKINAEHPYGDRFGLRALKPGMYVCDACEHKYRFTTNQEYTEKKKGRGYVKCNAGVNCKGVMHFVPMTQTEGVPLHVVEGLRSTYAEGNLPTLAAHVPEIYMILASASKVEWCSYNQVDEVRNSYKSKNMDIVPWQQGVISGEQAVGATLILSKYNLGWEAESVLFGHRKMGYCEQLIYVRRDK